MLDRFVKLCIYDVERHPFTIKLDVSTNRLVDKKYDGYVQYWSEGEHKVLNRYCGSLFPGPGTSNDLVNHFKQFVVDNELDSNYLLPRSMNGPNLNLVFQEKLSKYLRDNLDKSFLSLGTCSLHPVHTAFCRGTKSMSFNLVQFLVDIMLLNNGTISLNIS